MEDQSLSEDCYLSSALWCCLDREVRLTEAGADCCPTAGPQEVAVSELAAFVDPCFQVVDWWVDFQQVRKCLAADL